MFLLYLSEYYYNLILIYGYFKDIFNVLVFLGGGFINVLFIY